MRLASAGFGAAMTVAARLAAATMAVVVFCMAWSSGMFPVNECSLEQKVPPDATSAALFFDAPCSSGTLRSRKSHPHALQRMRESVDRECEPATIRAGSYTARSRHESAAPASAESPTSASTPTNPAWPNTSPPQVTPTVPPRKLHELSTPEPLPVCVGANVASAIRGVDA